MNKSRVLSLSAAVVLSSLAIGQERHAFPMRVLDAPMTGVLDMQPIQAEITALANLDEVVLTSVPLPGRASTFLVLERVQFDFTQPNLFLDGQPFAWDAGDLSVWKGNLANLPGSEVSLTLSSLGCYGWINDGVNLIHLTSNADASNGDWTHSISRWVTEEAMSQSAIDTRGPCMSDGLQTLPDAVAIGGATQSSPAGTQTLECQIAVETDYQLYQVWGNSSAQANYIMALLAAASDRYHSQINVVLSYPYVQFYSSSNDPWSSQDSGGSTVDLLYEFQGAWAGNIPAGAHLGAFISGAGLGGGVAWLDVICNDTYGFSVSANINGGVTFPVQAGSNTWDFVVLTHELGHNFSSPHTHDFCPPLDECAPNGYFGQCQSTQNCTSSGTIMSYCHLCNGGMNNVTTYFHPTVVNTMRAGAENSCIPDYNGGGGNDPVVLFSDDFESGFGSWTVAHNGRCKIHNNSGFSGAGARMKKGGGGTGACQIGTSSKQSWIEMPTLDTSAYSSVDVSFMARGVNTDGSCESVELQYNTGSGWVGVTSVVSLSWESVSVTLPAAAAGQSNLQLRFIANSKGKNNRHDVDEVEVVGNP